jgi:hypothetical protein
MAFLSKIRRAAVCQSKVKNDTRELFPKLDTKKQGSPAPPLLLVLFLTCLVTAPLAARTLSVGPGQALRAPSAAAAIAAPGDRIEIAPATYHDCAVWHADRLTITGTGPGVVISDRICQGKAIFVTTGRDITIARLTLEHARSPEHNGAGIRAEGGNLTLRAMRFIDNENGILAAPAPQGTIRIEDSLFRGNGICAPVCAHGVYVNDLAKLTILRSHFIDTHIGHHVKSRAAVTELIDNDIADGPTGTASYLVDVPNGGTLILKNNQLEKGPHSDNPGIAISIGEEGITHPGGNITITGNHFTNDVPTRTVFVRNLSSTPALLQNNTLKGDITPLEGPGTVR